MSRIFNLLTVSGLIFLSLVLGHRTEEVTITDLINATEGMEVPVTKTPGSGVIPDHLKNIFREASTDEIPSEVLAAVAYQESRFRPDVCSKAGACGLMQFMPATALEHAVQVFNEQSSAEGAANYLRRLYRRFDGNLGVTLAAYNWGQGNVSKWLSDGAKVERMPKETQNYVLKITGYSIRVWTGQVQGVGSLLQNVSKSDHVTTMRSAID